MTECLQCRSLLAKLIYSWRKPCQPFSQMGRSRLSSLPFAPKKQQRCQDLKRCRFSSEGKRWLHTRYEDKQAPADCKAAIVSGCPETPCDPAPETQCRHVFSPKLLCKILLRNSLSYLTQRVLRCLYNTAGLDLTKSVLTVSGWI